MHICAGLGVRFVNLALVAAGDGCLAQCAEEAGKVEVVERAAGVERQGAQSVQGGKLGPFVELQCVEKLLEAGHEVGQICIDDVADRV